LQIEQNWFQPVQSNLALNHDEWADPVWRLHHLYSIVDKNGKKRPFVPNDIQRHFLENYWYLNVILKARQQGFSTLIDLMLLDQALWVPDTKCHIIAQGLNEAQGLFRTKVRFPFRNMLPGLAELFPPVRETTMEYEFKNGSSISVGVSARSGTVQYLHVSELGKIARQFPQKAAEIQSGAFEAVGKGNFIFVESTAEGIGGLFHDMVNVAKQHRDSSDELTEQSWKLHFYPWHGVQEYRSDAKIEIRPSEERYFTDLENLGVRLDSQQKAWYVQKARTYERDPNLMLQEYPSTEIEPFKASNEDKFWGRQLETANAQGRICVFGIGSKPMQTFWDLGRDGMVCLIGQDSIDGFRWVNSLHSTGGLVSEMAAELSRLPYVFTDMWLPHDGEDKSVVTKDTAKAQLKAAFPNARIHIVPRVQHKQTAINAARERIGTDFFHIKTFAEALGQFGKYRKTWSEKLGIFTEDPVHDKASHYADAYMTYATGYRKATPQTNFPYVASAGGRTGY
jgi:hypothetical protein